MRVGLWGSSMKKVVSVILISIMLFGSVVPVFGATNISVANFCSLANNVANVNATFYNRNGFIAACSNLPFFSDLLSSADTYASTLSSGTDYMYYLYYMSAGPLYQLYIFTGNINLFASGQYTRINYTGGYIYAVDDWDGDGVWRFSQQNLTGSETSLGNSNHITWACVFGGKTYSINNNQYLLSASGGGGGSDIPSGSDAVGSLSVINNNLLSIIDVLGTRPAVGDPLGYSMIDLMYLSFNVLLGQTAVLQNLLEKPSVDVSGIESAVESISSDISFVNDNIQELTDGFNELYPEDARNMVSEIEDEIYDSNNGGISTNDLKNAIDLKSDADDYFDTGYSFGEGIVGLFGWSSDDEGWGFWSTAVQNDLDNPVNASLMEDDIVDFINSKDGEIDRKLGILNVSD